MKKKRIVYAPTVEEQKDPQIYRRQWMIYRNVIMPKTSRRKLLDDISIAFANCQEIDIQYRNGTPYNFYADIDEVFGNDCEMRSFSHYLEADADNKRPNRISRKLKRLEVLSLYIKIKYPRFTRYLENN